VERIHLNSSFVKSVEAVQFAVLFINFVQFRFRYYLFVKVPRPGDNEGTFAVFESNCHLLLPV